MTPARLKAHRATYGHAYRLKRRPDNQKSYCATCHSERNTAAFSERYATDPEFRARHNAAALKSITEKRKRREP